MANQKQDQRQEKKKRMTRLICLITACVMVVSILAAALLNTVW